MAAFTMVDPRAVSPVLAHVLNQVVESNAGCECSPDLLRFRAQDEPGVSVAAYLDRIARYGLLSGEAFVLALVYIDRVIMAQPGCIVTNLNVHRLLITAATLAAKFFDDAYCSNRHLAAVGGVSNAELNALEVDFLFLCGGGFKLFVEAEEYGRYLSELQAVQACAEGIPRSPEPGKPAAVAPAACQPPNDGRAAAGPCQAEGQPHEYAASPVVVVCGPPVRPIEGFCVQAAGDGDAKAATPASAPAPMAIDPGESDSETTAYFARSPAYDPLAVRHSQHRSPYTRAYPARPWAAPGPGCFVPHAAVGWTRQLHGSPA